MLEFLPLGFLRGLMVGLVIASILVTAYLDKEKFNFDWFNYNTALLLSAGMLAFAVVLEFLFEFSTPDVSSKILVGTIILINLWYFVTQLRDISQKFLIEDVDENELGE